MNTDLKNWFVLIDKRNTRPCDYRKAVFLTPLVVFLLLVASSGNLFSQDCSGVKTGGFILVNNGIKCAPALGPATVNISIGGVNDLNNPSNVEIHIDWTDGSMQVLSTTNGNLTWGGVGSGSYSNPTLTHIFPATAADGTVQCEYVPIATLYVAGTLCSTVGNPPTILRWNTDDENSGMLNLSETVTGNTVYSVCAGVATTVTFTDRTTLNCIPSAETANPNEAERWRQFVYGTGATDIVGATVTGNVAGTFPYSESVRNNGAAPTTALPSPVTTSSITIPATATVGQEFDITMYYWNTCNPYNVATGISNAVSTMAKIIIVASPQPDFNTLLGNSSGPVQTVFCIGDNIYFNDLTPPIGGTSFRYDWQFFDNSTGTGAPLSTSNNHHPIFAYASGGQKLIRFTVTENAAGLCSNTVDKLIMITPTLLAEIQPTDLSNNPITPNFCQNSSAPLNTFQVRFNDVSIGTASATTQWQWQFYDQNNVLTQQVPAVGFSSVQLGPFDKSFTNYGIYNTILIIHDMTTGCETKATQQVFIYDNPVPNFTASRTCQGQLNTFTESSTLNPINGESIVLREWDFNYDGVTFNKDPAYDNQTSFTRSMGAAGTYQVALRVTTNQNNCSAIFVSPVIVDPLPLATFTVDVASGCSILTANFTNTSILAQPDLIDRYVWEVDANQGLGFQPVATQKPTDPAFSNLFTTQFQNTGIVNAQEFVRLHVYTVHNCETISAPVTITIFPGTKSGFIEANYSPFNSNCSPQSVTFNVDAATQSRNPVNYTWTISNTDGVLSTASTGTTPSFTYSFSNATQTIENFSVQLTSTLPSGCFGDSIRTIQIAPVPSSLFTVDTLQFDCQVTKVSLNATQVGLPFYHWVISENGSIVSDVTGAADQFQFTFNNAASNINVQFSLDTKNLANCSSAVTSSSFIVPQAENLSASFSASPLSQTLPSSTVNITNTSSAGPWTYLWDFGDSTASTNPAISSHTYDTSGVYTISLKISDKGCSQSQTMQVTILPNLPIVDFSYLPASGCQPLTVQFTNLSQFTDPSTYSWQFGDGGTSKAVNPTYTYITPGTYSVSLSASNTTGKTAIATKSSIIDVLVTPVASFEITPPVVYIPGGILYTANHSLDATGYYWDFGDGGTSTEFRPEHTYKAEGSYTITLAVTNASGCSDTSRLADPVVVKNANQILVPNAFSPGGDSKNDIFLPLMRGVTQFEMLIFNRWGQLLFETHDQSTGWDGYYKGKLCEQDVYMYKLSVLLNNGETLVRVGDINLIR